MEVENKISVIDIVPYLWDKRKQIFLGLAISGFCAIGLYFITKRYYTTEVVLVPQLETANGPSGVKGLGNLASLAGIELGSAENTDFPPSLYGEIIEDVAFQRDLLNTKLYYLEIKDSVTYRDYYLYHFRKDLWGFLKTFTIGLPGQVVKLIKGKSKESGNQYTGYLSLSDEDFQLVENLKDQVKIDANFEDGYIRISVTMDDKYLAAQMLTKIQNRFEQVLTDFRTQKLKREIRYLEERVFSQKEIFEVSTHELANFKDRNSNLITERSRIFLNNLQLKYDLAYAIYKQLSEQLEQVKIQASKSTPLVAVVKPINIPNEKSSPNTIAFLFLITMFGGLVTLIILFRRELLSYLKINVLNR